MAGFIRVNQKGVSIPSAPFDLIVERIRKHLEGLSDSVRHSIYEAKDDGGMDLLVLHELDGDSFKNFVEGTLEAYKATQNDQLLTEQGRRTLEYFPELIDLLKNDPRAM